MLTNFTAMTVYNYNGSFWFSADECVNWNNYQLQLLAVECWNKFCPFQPTFKIKGDN